MPKIAELIKQRAKAFDEFKALAEKETLTEAELADYEVKKRAVTDIDAQITRAKDAQALSAATAQPVEGQDAPGNKVPATVQTDKYVKERSLVIGAAAKMMAYGGGNLFNARQASAEVYGESHPVTRALVASTGPAGGFIVPPDYMNEIIELLRPAAVVRGSNPRVIPMPRGTMTLPGQASPATATYGAEGSQIASSQQTLKQIVASFKKLTALVPISNDLMRYADPAIDAMVRDDLVEVLALREDLAFLLGDGTQAAPMGFTGFANAWAVSQGGTAGVWSVSANSVAGVNGNPGNPLLGQNGGNFITSNETYTEATVVAELTGMINRLDTANVPDRRRVWFTANSWHYVEWDLTFSSSGNYTVWLDGVQAFSGVGNLRTSGNSTVNAVILSGHIINFDDMYLFDNTGSTNNAQRGDSRIETLFPTADASIAFTPNQGVIGAYYSINGLNGYLSANQLFLRKYTAPVSGTLNSISVMPNQTSGTINFKPAVYADNVGSPGTLLSGGATVNGCVGGTPVVMALTTPQSLTAGTPYWLGYVADTDLNTLRQDAAAAQTNSGYQAGISYTSGPPSTAPSMSSNQYSLMVWGSMTGMSTNYTETNELPPGGDLSCVSSSTVGAEDLYNFTSLSSAPSNIAGVKISTLLRKTDSGARTISVQLKSGSTEVSSAAVTPGSSYTYYSNYQDTDPDTSAAWTASGINSLAAGAKIAS